MMLEELERRNYTAATRELGTPFFLVFTFFATRSFTIV
jgi:hypothetical protein